MIGTATRQRPTLPMQRAALLTRIDAARQTTAQVGNHLATDLEALVQLRRSFFTGLRLLRASVVAAGVVWSFNASSRIGRGSRLFTTALSLLSTVRAMRKIGTLLSPLIQSQSTERQG